MTTLDTSGTVMLADFVQGGATSWSPGLIAFSGLSPFAQGYVEALLGDLSSRLLQPNEDGPCGVEFGFSDLAPEALAMILRDCEHKQQIVGPPITGPDGRELFYTDERGRAFWEARQAGEGGLFPPLRVHLNDAGNVMLEEAT